MRSLLTACAGLLLCAGLAGQAPAFNIFGTGCSFQGQTLRIGSQGEPRLGSGNFRIMYFGPNYTFNSSQQIAWPWLVLGFAPQNTPLPPGFLPQQPPGCAGFISPDFVFPAPPDTNGRPAFENFKDLPVPNDPGLLGFVFYAQWMLWWEQCGIAGCALEALPTSDAAMIVVGI